MRVIKNKYIPVKKFVAMAVFPLIFVREDRAEEFTKEVENHEKIHFAQQKELFLIGFYLLYLFYWIKYGYRNNPFEKEAYTYQGFNDYLKIRGKFAWRDIHKKGY